jgi:hypothetical protein
MYFYNVLPTKNMGQNLSILVYSSQKQASVGDIVEISIRYNVDYGLVLSENLEEKSKYDSVATVSPQKTHEVSNSLDDIVPHIQDSSFLQNSISKTNPIKNEIKKFEIKEINKVLPIKLSMEQIQFLKIFSDNTFNSLNDTWDALTMPYGLLTQKQWIELENITNSTESKINSPLLQNHLHTTNISNNWQKAQNEPIIEDKKIEDLQKKQVLSNSFKIAPKVDFLIDLDIKVRIMYIIRSLICSFQAIVSDSNSTINKQLLIIFPEKKYLNKIYKFIANEILKSKELLQYTELLYYASEPTKKPKECIWSMLNIKNVTATTVSPLKNYNSNQTSQNTNITSKLQIILSTRSGLFLPFTSLTDIILVDEGNSMYIQDQNSLYYDTREAIFLISKAFNANISFISPLPSIRLYNMYNKDTLEKEMVNNQAIAQKPRKIKITRFDKKSSNNDLFGYEIEQVLTLK